MQVFQIVRLSHGKYECFPLPIAPDNLNDMHSCSFNLLSLLSTDLISKNYCVFSAFTCNPHSFCDVSHHHLPALGSSPASIALVQGAQPMLINPLSCK